MIKLDTDEKIVLKSRKHWFVLLKDSYLLIFMILFPFIVWGIYSNISELELLIPLNENIFPLLAALAAAWLLFIWVAFFFIWTDYYLDILILTNKRLINIEQKGLFSRNVSTLYLKKIQDVTIEIHGIIATLLNFGDVHIQTAGQQREFVARGMVKPNKIKRGILKTQVNTMNPEKLI